MLGLACLGIHNICEIYSTGECRYLGIPVRSGPSHPVPPRPGGALVLLLLRGSSRALQGLLRSSSSVLLRSPSSGILRSSSGVPRELCSRRPAEKTQGKPGCAQSIEVMESKE